MKEKYFNIITYSLLVIYILLGLLISIFTKYNILFKSFYMLLLLLPGISGVLFHKNKTNGLLLIAISIVIMLVIMRIISINKCFIILSCIGIIYIGINVIINNLFIPDRYTFNRDNRFYWSLFSETKDIVSNTKFNGCTIWSIFGSTTLDIYQSKLEDNSVIRVISIFGSTNIVAKENMNIILSSKNILGDSMNYISVKKNNRSKDLYIKSLTILGSLKIR